jgi:hypothetical protein
VSGYAGVDPLVYDAETLRSYCLTCAIKGSVGMVLPALSYQEWVRTGDVGTLREWRRQWRMTRIGQAG